MKQDYRYDAFISYRHVEPDRSHAKWIHKALETYRVPASIVKINKEKGIPSKISRVFRDEEELPACSDLSSEITKALDESRYLIVICSPRIVSSVWCDAEVKRFRELGRHDKIIALLTEGEPHESFLPSLCEIRKEIVKEDGSKVEEIETIEPLAADIRPRSDISVKESKNLAKLRILSTLLDCKFDDLRRRELKRRQKRMALALSTAVVLLIAFAVIAIWALNAQKIAEEQRTIAIDKSFEAEKQKIIAEQQRDAAEHSAYRANLLLAKNAYQNRDKFNGHQSLLNCPPHLRNWPWQYMWKRNHQYQYEILGHTFAINKIQLSPNGKILASVSKGRDVYLWNAKNYKFIKRIPESLIGDKDLCFSTDGKFLFYTGHDFSIKILDTENFSLIKSLEGHKDRIIKLAINKNGSLLASYSQDQTIKIWDLKALREKVQFKTGTPDLIDLAFHQKHSALITAFKKGTVKNFNLNDGRLFRTYNLKTPIVSLNFNPVSELVFIGHIDGLLSIRKFINLKELQTNKDLFNNITDVAFSKNGKLAAMTTHYGDVKVFDTEKLRFIKTFMGHTRSAMSVQFSPNSNTIYSAGLDKTIKVWKAPFKDKSFLGLHKGSVYFAHYLPKSGTLISGGQDSKLVQWNMNANSPQKVESLNLGKKAAVANNEDLIAVINMEKETAVIELRDENLKLVSTIDTKLKEIRNLKFSPDDTELICSNSSNKVWVWDIKTKSITKTLTDAKNLTYTLDISPDGKYIASGTTHLNIWATNDNQLVKSFAPHIRGVHALAFSPDNNYLVTGGLDKVIKLWNAKNFELIATFEGSNHYATDFKFSPDSTLLISGNRLSEIKVWDLKTKKELPSLFEEHRVNGLRNLHTISFSPDGQKFVTTGIDNKIRIWDAKLSVMAKDIKGQSTLSSTRLIQAIQNDSSTELIKDLIILADLSYKDEKNMSILDHAIESKNENIVSLLKSTGAFQ